MNYTNLIAKHGLLSEQIDKEELGRILELFDSTIQANIHGDVVEFGCYNGTTSVYLRRLLPEGKTLHVYDSFQGLPQKSSIDESPLGLQFQAGELHASQREFRQNFFRAGLRLPKIHKAWFQDLTENDIPEAIAFAFLDGDYYESIMTPLKLIWPRLSPGSIVVVDDYSNQALPGAAKAVDEWLRHKHVAKFYNTASLGVMVLAA